MEKVGYVIGGKVGMFLKVDTDQRKIIIGKWLRVQIEVEISKQLTYGMWLSLAGGRRIWLTCRFERLPDYCYVCGCLNHLEQDCARVIEMKIVKDVVGMKFGSSLRANGMRLSYLGIQEVVVGLGRLAHQL